MKKKLILTAIAFMLAVTGFSQSADDFSITQNTDNTITITDYKGTTTDVVIPSTLHSLKVTVIGKKAFFRKNLTGVIIPDSVTLIEIDAFSENKLTQITLGKGLKDIGSGAFYGNMLTGVVIPDTVTAIGGGAFAKNKLIEITLGKGLKTIGGGVFANNQISELSLPAGLKEIRLNAFGNNQIRALTIPNGVTLIRSRPPSLSEQEKAQEKLYGVLFKMHTGTSAEKSTDGAFINNPLEFLSIPASLAKKTDNREGETIAGIADGTFGNTPACIVLPAGMDEDTLRYNFEEALVNFYKSQNKAAGGYIKRGPVWTKATADEAKKFFEENIETKRKEAEAAAHDNAVKQSGFTVDKLGNGSLVITGYTGNAKDVIIPAEINGKPVTVIGKGAFNERVAAGEITGVVIPDSVTEIGRYAFANISMNDTKKGKSKLTTVKWGKGLKKIEKEVFWENSSLKTINAGTDNSQTFIDAYAFDEKFMEVWKKSGDKPRTYTKGFFGGWSAK